MLYKVKYEVKKIWLFVQDRKKKYQAQTQYLPVNWRRFWISPGSSIWRWWTLPCLLLPPVLPNMMSQPPVTQVKKRKKKNTNKGKWNKWKYWVTLLTYFHTNNVCQFVVFFIHCSTIFNFCFTSLCVFCLYLFQPHNTILTFNSIHPIPVWKMSFLSLWRLQPFKQTAQSILLYVLILYIYLRLENAASVGWLKIGFYRCYLASLSCWWSGNEQPNLYMPSRKPPSKCCSLSLNSHTAVCRYTVYFADILNMDNNIQMKCVEQIKYPVARINDYIRIVLALKNIAVVFSHIRFHCCSISQRWMCQRQECTLTWHNAFNAF